MDGEHIEMIISGWSSTELREKALVELGNMREELYVLRAFAKYANETKKLLMEIFTQEEKEEIKERVDDPDWDISQQEDVRLILEKLANYLAAEHRVHWTAEQSPKN